MTSLKHLEFFCNKIPSVLEYYDRKEVKPVQYFALGLLRRLLHSSQSLNILLKKFTETPEVDFSAGLTIRAILLDMLISLNFYKLVKDNLEKKVSSAEMDLALTKYCEQFLSDGLDHTSKYLEQSAALGLKTQDEVKEAFNTFAKSYATFFLPHSEDGARPKLKHPRAPSTIDLFKALANDKEMKWISGVYDSYLFYSKYDHFGILYYDIITEDLGSKIRMIDKTIRLFTRHCTILYDTLDRYSQKDPFIEGEYKKVAEYMMATINGV